MTRHRWPVLSLRIVKQREPQGPDDERDRASDLVEEDQADIKAGRAVMVEVQLLQKDSAKAIPKLVDSLVNRIGPPSAIGTYLHPEHICDPGLRRLAVDMWAVNFVTAGDLIRWRGREYLVEGLEDIDREHGPVGYYTGFAFCRRTDSPPGGRCHPCRLPVDELVVTVRTNSVAISKTGQSVSKEAKA
ncbi:hypothetical protein ACIQWZ_38870 [Streptomyces sp. NPDC098077]|uniref:hypothetical protein n=1 Tax=Streptomyces sp. NPDC098077 TaxID=3366093 RepID=UPI003809BFBD